jgi:hypothetical protein
MAFLRVLASALLGAVACTAGSPVAGKWTCTNVPVTGPESPWTLLLREDGTKLGGLLTDGSVEIPLSQVKVDGASLTFRFEINGKPYEFAGKFGDRKLEGTYSGAEASGQLRCANPTS